jgi:hypothetical protein
MFASSSTTSPPIGFLVLSVADQGTIELHLLFAKA